MAMTYGTIYVASVAMGAKDEHTLKAFLEAEAFDGPAVLIAYSHCIAHGINMTTAVNSAQWLLYRFNPERTARGENPLQIDSGPPKLKVADYFAMENRFRMLEKIQPDAAKECVSRSQQDVDLRRQLYESLAARHVTSAKPTL